MHIEIQNGQYVFVSVSPPRIYTKLSLLVVTFHARLRQNNLENVVVSFF